MSKKPENMTESMIKRRLEELKRVPTRDPLKAASGRVRFLREANEHRQAMIPIKSARQPGWVLPLPFKRLAMTALVTLLLTVSLLAGAGATVAAAQDDLPDQPLYALKLWSEDVTLSMYSDPQEQAALLMSFAETRVQEMAALEERGVTPPDQVRQRLDKHLRQALVLAADMDESSRDQVLLQLQKRLQQQDRVIEKLETNANPQAVTMFTETRQMLQDRLQLVDEGLVDPKGFEKKIETEIGTGLDDTTTKNSDKPGKNGSGGQPSGNQGNGNNDHTPGQPNSNGSKNGNNGQNPKNGNENDSGGNQ